MSLITGEQPPKIGHSSTQPEGGNFVGKATLHGTLLQRVTS